MADTSRGVDDRSLGELVATASRELSALVRDEISLAKAELRQDAKAAAGGGALFVAAGLCLSMVLILLSVTAAHGLHALGLGMFWAYLIVTGAYLLLAGVFVLVGVVLVRRIRRPERTIRTTRDNLALLRRGRTRAERD